MQEKNVINIRKKDVKLSLFTDHMSVYGENSKESRDEILVNNLTKLLDTEPIYKNFSLNSTSWQQKIRI